MVDSHEILGLDDMNDAADPADVARRSRRRVLVGGVAAAAVGLSVARSLSGGSDDPDAAGRPPDRDGPKSSSTTTESPSTTMDDHDHGPSSTHGADEPSQSLADDVGDLLPWSSPEAWGGSVPAPGADVVLSNSILLDLSVDVSTLSVPEGLALVFDSGKALELRSTGNVVIEGLLSMRPESRAVEHRIQFLNVDESRMVGGGMAALASDVGLWVMGAGVLDLVGSETEPWARTTAPLLAGETSLNVDRDTTGWSPGDQLVITPTGSPADGDPADGYDSVSVTSVSGRTVRFSPPLRHDHPFTTVHRGATFGPEVLNLSRNVGVEGTARGRAHVLVHAPSKHTVDYTELKHLGPRRGDSFVLGRYGLHFHHCGDGARGTSVQGAVVHSSGNHAFVSHMSNGVTFDRCITHDTREDAYWWDGPRVAGGNGTESFDVRFLSCVASATLTGDVDAGRRLAGFSLGRGGGNECTGCVAVGIVGGRDSAGFKWPEKGAGPWLFEDCIGHNNGSHGIFVWQNDAFVRPVDRFTAYHNGGAGILHGAYTNNFRYSDSDLHANGQAAAVLHAMGKADGLQWNNVVFDGGGVSPNAFLLPSHQLPSEIPVRISGCVFRGSTGVLVSTSDSGRERPLETAADSVDFVNCEFDGTEQFFLSDLVHPDSLLRVQSGNEVTELRRSDQAGVLNQAWNARVTVVSGTIPPPTPGETAGASGGKGGGSAVGTTTATTSTTIASTPTTSTTIAATTSTASSDRQQKSLEQTRRGK